MEGWVFITVELGLVFGGFFAFAAYQIYVTEKSRRKPGDDKP